MLTFNLASHQDLERRLDDAGWGVFLVMSGALLLIPGVPDGAWLTGVGAIFVGFSALRRVVGIPVSWVAVILGIVAMAAGIGAMAGVTVPAFALLLLLCGIAILVAGFARQPRRS